VKDGTGRTIGWADELVAVNGGSSPEEAVAKLWLALNKK